MSEEWSFDALYRKTGPRLWRAILAFTAGRRDITDDVVAEAFARTLENRDGVRSPEKYLYRVAFRLAARELQRPGTVSDVPDVAHSDDSELTELFDALRALPPGQRAAVFLHYQADLPTRKVAELMGTSSAVVRVQLVRGRRTLARLLGDRDDD